MRMVRASPFYLALCSLVALSTSSSTPSSCSEKEWWKNTVVYQILVPSFKDSNHDGVGDLRGIIQKLDYLEQLGIETIWLTPFYSGPNGDIGYDISNHTEVGSDFGAMKDFDELLSAVHAKGMKLVIEFVPNHSSFKHDWFIKSAQKVSPYTDYYVWMDGKPSGGPPNNWLSKRSGPMWKFHEHRQQYYLHQFLDELPDLNYRSTDLVNEMEKILEFWLKKGVDGFGMDSVLKLFEDKTFADEPKLLATTLPDNDPNAYEHIHTIDQSETYNMIYKWRGLLDKYSNQTKQPRVLITEAYSPSLDKVALYFGSDTEQGTHLSVNYEIMNKFGVTSNAKDLETIITTYMKSLPSGKWHSWMVGGHSVKRIASRYSPEIADAMNMLTLLLPGTAITFAGDELAMENAILTYEDQKDPEGFIFGKNDYLKVCRDGSRIPFQWSDEENAGFSVTKPWLPVHPNYWYLNAQAQIKSKQSHYAIYKDLVTLRSTSKAVRLGDYKIETSNDYLFILSRSHEDSSVHVVINFNSKSESVNVRDITGNGEVSLYTSSTNSGLQPEKYEGNDKKIVLRPKASVVFTRNYKASDCKSGSFKFAASSIVLMMSILYIILVQ